MWTIWLKRLLKDLNELVNEPIPIYCDNLNSIQLAQNPVFHARTRHIEVHYHYIQERIVARDIDLWYVGINVQMTDFFTKAVGQAAAILDEPQITCAQSAELEGERWETSLA